MNAQIQFDDLEPDLQSFDADCRRVDTALQSLESIMIAHDIAATIPNMDENTHRLLEHSVECFIKLGSIGRPAKSFVPSNEAYKRHDISEVAVEGFGQGIRNVFMSIIDAIKKAFDWMWNFIKRLFGRGKDREEKIEALKTQAEEIKSNVKEMSEEDKKNAPYRRTPEGWFEKVKLDRPAVLERIVTSQGLMNRTSLDKFQTEMARVFHLQSKNMQAGMHVKNGAETLIHYDPPLPPSHDSSLTKLVSVNPRDKVYLSLEFGSGQYIYVVVPSSTTSSDQAESSRWIEGLRIGEIKAPNAPSYEKFALLEGDMANADYVLDMLQMFNKMMRHHAEHLETFMTAKKLFIRDVEKTIKDEGITMFSSREKKAQRDTMLGHLRYFKKVMDQPALTYYGKCDGILNAFEHTAMAILAFNRKNGNQVELKREEK